MRLKTSPLVYQVSHTRTHTIYMHVHCDWIKCRMFGIYIMGLMGIDIDIDIDINILASTQPYAISDFTPAVTLHFPSFPFPSLYIKPIIHPPQTSIYIIISRSRSRSHLRVHLPPINFHRPRKSIHDATISVRVFDRSERYGFLGFRHEEFCC